MEAINLSSEWPLHGAASTDQLNLIVNALRDARGSYDAVAASLKLPRAVVANVACWYQSLWLRA